MMQSRLVAGYGLVVLGMLGALGNQARAGEPWMGKGGAQYFVGSVALRRQGHSAWHIAHHSQRRRTCMPRVVATRWLTTFAVWVC